MNSCIELFNQRFVTADITSFEGTRLSYIFNFLSKLANCFTQVSICVLIAMRFLSISLKSLNVWESNRCLFIDKYVNISLSSLDEFDVFIKNALHRDVIFTLVVVVESRRVRFIC